MVNAYLRQVADSAIILPTEKQGIDTSILTLEKRLSETFSLGMISKKIIFGSYARQTMLPRWMDGQSDVDYLIVFSDSDKQPQTYLDRLKNFVERRYTNSVRYQDHPTVALGLSHIRLELVPAINRAWGGLQIPAKGEYFKWIATQPDDFSKMLDNADRSRKGLIRPVARLAKYWNARSGYVFESFELEKKVVAHGFGWMPDTLEAHFFSFMESLSVSYMDAQWRKDRIISLKQALAEVKTLKAQPNSGAAVTRLAKLLPPRNGVIFPDVATLLANWPLR